MDLRRTVYWLGLALVIAGCSEPAPRAGELQAAGKAMRIVSLDYCADQYVLKLLDRDRILAVSPDADADFSYMRDAAAGLAQVRPLAEDVLILQPDLVVRSYGGGANAQSFFERAGVPVLQVGYTDDIASVRRTLRDVADGLGATERAEAVIADMDARLNAMKDLADGRDALYMTPAGVTSGSGTLVHEILRAAGLENFQEKPGWRSLPLERLAYERPDLVAAAFFDSHTNHQNAWSPARHPVARRQLDELPKIYLQGAWMSCGGWFLLDAVEALAATSAAPGEQPVP